MRTDHARAHASYCFAKAQTAPTAASRKRWTMECADWLELGLGRRTEVEKLEAEFAGFPLLKEARSFG